MKRIWSIEEQSFNDPASGFGFEFTSPATSATPDRGLPKHDNDNDNEVVLKIANQARGITLVLVFDRNGMKMSSDVVREPPAETPPEELARDPVANPDKS